MVKVEAEAKVEVKLTVKAEAKVEVKLTVKAEDYKMVYCNFTEMPVWQRAYRLAVEIFNLTVNLPRSEDYGLTSQIRRSSNGIAACLAEGIGRNTKKDKSNFYIIARGSAYETESHLLYGKGVGYFNSQTVEDLINEVNEIIHDLNKLIKSLT